jgi:hypothetical protein
MGSNANRTSTKFSASGMAAARRYADDALDSIRFAAS